MVQVPTAEKSQKAHHSPDVPELDVDHRWYRDQVRYIFAHVPWIAGYMHMIPAFLVVVTIAVVLRHAYGNLVR